MILLVAAVGSAFIVANRLVRGPDFVDRLTIRNPTEYIVDVSVTDEHRRAHAPVAALEPHRTTVVRSVIDPGDPWILEFRIAGTPVGDLRLSHARLERQHWRVVIPDAVGDRIQHRAR